MCIRDSFKTNIFNSEDVKQVLKNCDLAINLVGILYETRKQKFDQIHSQFPYLLSNLSNKVGIKNLSSGPKITEGLKMTDCLKIS